MTQCTVKMVVLSALLFAAAAGGGTIVLTDGSQLAGDLRRVEGGYEVLTQAGGKQFVADGDVASIKLGGGAAATRAADGSLDSLRRATANVDDLGEVVARYEDFVARAADGPAKDEAAAELAELARMRDDGYVRWAGGWVSVEEQRRLAAAALGQVNDVRLQIKNGQTSEARTELGARLREDSDDVSALYLLGVLAWQAGDVVEARDRFERVAELAPDHGPSANNLGVVLLRQNQPARALLFFDKALRAEPVNKTLLDNAAEVLQLVPEDARDARPYADLAATFADQDERLRASLAEQGWYRWGGRWVDEATYEQLSAEREAAEQRLAALRADYDATQARMSQLEADAAQARRTMENIAANSVYRDRDGRVVRRPLPDIYYQLERDVQRYEQEQAALAGRLEAINREAAAVNESTPPPTYTGDVEFINEDGVPAPLPLP